MKKFLMFGGILTGIVVLFWVGVSVYDARVNVEVNPNADQHMNTIKPTFDIEIIDNVKERITILNVSPKIMRALERSPEPKVVEEDTETEPTEE